MLFRKIFAVDYENHKKPYIYILWNVFNVNASGIYSNSCALSG
jgi:hypothetical protein